MKLPFTTDQFLQVFVKYNTGIFPMQIIFYLAAFLIIYFIIKKDESKSKTILYILTFMWFWMGIVYHIIYFAEINKAAYLFGLLFIIQGGLFLYSLRKGDVLFSNKNNIYSFIGWLLIVYGLFIYPVFGYLNGHLYPAAPILGAPCPTAIFTFGILLFTNRLPKILLIIPVLWSLLGFSAAIQLSIIEDYGLIISGLLTLGLILYRDAKVMRQHD